MDILCGLWQSDNLVYRYVAVRVWQEYEPQNPMGFLSNDYFFHPASVLYAKGKVLTEYMTADRSLLPLVVYYLKSVYIMKTYLQKCKRCGKLFRANTANIPTFCGDECKKAQNRENKRRFDEKAKETPYEAACKTNYMYWYNRMAKLRKSAPGTDRLADAEGTFSTFYIEAVKRKKAVANGEADDREFETWMLMQRDVIDTLMVSS